MSRRKRRYFKAPRGDADRAAPRGNGRPSRRKWLAVALIAPAVALAAIVALVYLRVGGGPEPPRAAIIDQLALTDPNPSLMEKARQMLVDAGYTVDYYPSARVTVDLYRRLPARGYKLVIVRSHSSGEQERRDFTAGGLVHVPLISLFTSERYVADRYVDDQRERRLDVVRIGHRWNDGPFGPGVEVSDPPADRYFGITPAFIETGAQGRFDGTTILLMGCDGVNTDGMAAALMRKGAEAVAGWDAQVTATHTDDALAHVLRHLLVDRLALRDAVASTMSDIGPDPAFGAKFVAYPKN